MKKLLVSLLLLVTVVISIFSIGLFVQEPPQTEALSPAGAVGCWVECVAMSADVHPDFLEIRVADCFHYNCL